MAKAKSKGGAKAKSKASGGSSARSVVSSAKQQGVQFVDFKFVDFPGTWQHFSLPIGEFDADMFTDGLGFDGSSIRGWKAINESDMLVMPQLETAFMDPFTAVPTLSFVCDIIDPITREDYSRDPRAVARRAESYLKSTGVADTAFFGPEAEFFVFDDIRYDQNANSGCYVIDSVEGAWNSGAEEDPNLGYKPPHKGGYFPVPPHDSLQDLRSEMVTTMMEADIEVEVHHHEVGTAGQCEIDIKYCPMLICGDRMMKYKYIVKNTAFKHGKTATFMPKPIFGDNGTGMHTHQSLWKGGKPLDKNIYALSPEELGAVPLTPGSLEEAMDALEADHDFLLKGDVFSQDLVDSWIDYKRTEEIDALRLRPHPYEFALYYDMV